MRTVVLAGGYGTRLAEETGLRPKPMVEIGGKPMLWHIMQIYAAQGYNDFIVACGYKSEYIKEYFHNFFIRNSDYRIDLKSGSLDIVNPNGIDWKVGIIDTGLATMTGGRLLRLKTWLEGGTFMVAYGDSVGNVDIPALVAFHRSHGKLATVTAVHPPSRFGALDLDGERVRTFSEKPQTGEGWINGGFFVFEPAVLNYIEDDSTVLERQVLERLAAEDQLRAYRHAGFWQPMDTIREKQMLEALWDSGKAPWRISN